MIRNQNLEKEERLKSKTIDAQLAESLRKGLNCSMFEAETVVKLARDTYCSSKYSSISLSPGQMVVTVISAMEGASRRIKDASFIRAIITVDCPKDVDIRKAQGVDGLRRHRIVRVCQEVFDQGGLMTVEDLSHRVFNVGERTIIRDLRALRNDEIDVPLRSTIKDIGRTVTHKEEIIRLWLSGKQYSYISRAVHHSIPAVKNYINTFKRIIALDTDGHTISNIAFLAGASPTLVKAYLALWHKYRPQATSTRINETEQPFKGINKGENKHSGKNKAEKKGGAKV